MARERNPHPPPISGCSAVWLARFIWGEDVGSSNLSTPTIFSTFKVKYVLYGGYRQEVKTWDCGSHMRGFESHYPPLNLIMHSIGVSPSGKAMDSDSIMRRFESCYPSHRRVVSIGKTTVSKTVILGSNPSSSAILSRKLDENAQIRLCALSNRQLC